MRLEDQLEVRLEVRLELWLEVCLRVRYFVGTFTKYSFHHEIPFYFASWDGREYGVIVGLFSIILKGFLLGSSVILILEVSLISPRFIWSFPFGF